MKQTVPCWICGSPANSGEHKTKKSDLKAVFGTPSQSQPLFYSDDDRTNIPIGSLKNDRLKSPSLICTKCNGARTQPHDRAWEELSSELRSRISSPHGGRFIRANRIFKYDTRKHLLNVHLYFVKNFGCRILEGSIPVDIQTFSASIMNGKANPHVYLKFGYLNSPAVGTSDIDTEQTTDGKCAFATWFYEVGNLAVNVMYAIDGEDRQGLIDAWHPKHGTSKLTIDHY